MSEQKYQGTVKWFSNRKGYGFITPGDGCPIMEDIFVHQSTVHSEGYRTLSEGWTVEFSVGKDDDGKAKAENVTAPGGGFVRGPRKMQRRPPRKGADVDKSIKDEDAEDAVHTADEAEAKEGEEKAAGGGGEEKKGGGRKGRRPRSPRNRGGERGGAGGGGGERNERGGGGERGGRGPRPPPQPHWHEILSDDVKKALDSKGVRTSTGTIDVSSGTSRIKLGTRGYSSMADARGMLAEGTFECNADGKATFAWKRAMKFSGGEWSKMDEKAEELPSSLMLGSDSVGAVGPDETPTGLWGDGPTDPRPALESNGFEMRRVVLTTKRR